MATRKLTTWGIGLVLMFVVGFIALWFIRVIIGVTAALVKLGIVVAVGLALVYVVRELYDGWSRAG